jgi:hypothetical protein
VTKLQAGSLGFNSWQRQGSFLFTTVSRLTLGLTQPHIQWIPRALSLGVKWLGHEADHSPISSAEVKNAQSYTFTHLYVVMVWQLVKIRYNFIFKYFIEHSVSIVV